MTNQEQDEIQATTEKVANRRAFLKSAGGTGLGLASAGILAGKMGAFDKTPVAKALGLKTTAVHAAEDIDVAILNFALNLEYLEAEFYTYAVYGESISAFGIGTSGVGTEGPTTGGQAANFNYNTNVSWSNQLRWVAESLCNDEQAHVKLLRGALGSAAVAKPAINLGALGIGFANTAQFITVARALEDTGVSAYGGAAPLITSKAYLGVAAQIAEVEANHSGALRLFCAIAGVSVGPLDALDVVPPPAGKNYFVVDSNALAIIRTTSQVLAIAYGNSAAGTDKGGFFPAGLNGAITTV